MRAYIFDLDGLLIDSEPWWRHAEMAVLRPLGVPLTEAMCAQTKGLRLDAVVRYWFARHPWAGPDLEAVHEAILVRMVRHLGEDALALPGAVEAVRACKATGRPVVVATSSPRRLVPPALRRLGLDGVIDGWHSAEDERYGKPHPAVYLRAAEGLGVAPTDCVAFEDSLTGLVAAKAARIPTLVVPAAEDADDPRFALADWRRPTLVGFDPTVLEPAP